MAKRKVDSETRWEAEPLFNITHKPVCLICGANVGVIKEFNLERHKTSRQAEKAAECRAEAAESRRVKKNLTSQQTFHQKSSPTQAGRYQGKT